MKPKEKAKYTTSNLDNDKYKDYSVLKEVPKQERMYSEEDMKQFAEWLIKINFNYTSNISDIFLVWKKQFKKK